jgi:hypothetical protein
MDKGVDCGVGFGALTECILLYGTMLDDNLSHVRVKPNVNGRSVEPQRASLSILPLRVVVSG